MYKNGTLLRAKDDHRQIIRIKNNGVMLVKAIQGVPMWTQVSKSSTTIVEMSGGGGGAGGAEYLIEYKRNGEFVDPRYITQDLIDKRYEEIPPNSIEFISRLE